MKKTEEIDEKLVEELVAGGIIGAALGALLTGSEKGTMLGAIAGAALLATYQANQRAQATNLPVLIAENGKLYKIFSTGEKIFIKNLPQSQQTIPKKYNLR